MRLITLLIFVIGIIGGIFFYMRFIINQDYYAYIQLQGDRYQAMRASWEANYRHNARRAFRKLREEGCQEMQVAYSGASCMSTRTDCFDNLHTNNIRHNPQCIHWGGQYLDTPESVRGVYLTSYAVGDANIRSRILKLISETEINTVVIDIKESDGIVATELGDYDHIPFQKEMMPGIDTLLEKLYNQRVYTIARIVLFKDQKWAEAFPEDAVKRKDDPTRVWKDYRGKTYIDPGSDAYRAYLIALSLRIHQMGFDEIQVDYIRFPSDGDTANTYYPYSQNALDTLGAMNGRVAVLEEFMRDYTEALRAVYPDIVLSADTFGMTTSLNNDLSIGQMQKSFMEYFDFVSPMVYPSHYPKFFIALEGHPDNHPYEVVYKAMNDGVLKAQRAGQDPNKLRPWLQDFTCTWCTGYFPYGAEEVRAQIKATYDAGLDSWLLWNAGSRYTRGALKGAE
ncbi:MAG: putative glycoside hydrolase [Patescibacteria group bacterium]